VTFSSLTVGSYVGDVKLVYETGYGIMLSLYNDTTSSWMYGATVTSSAARRSAVIAFAANVPADIDGAGAAAAVQAQVVASMLVSNPQAIQGLTSSITIANARLLFSGATSTAVTAPLASDISAAHPVTAATGAGATSSSSADADNDALLFGVIGAIVAALIALGAVVFYFRGSPSEVDPKELACQLGQPGDGIVLDMTVNPTDTFPQASRLAASSIEIEKVSTDSV